MTERPDDTDETGPAGTPDEPPDRAPGTGEPASGTDEPASGTDEPASGTDEVAAVAPGERITEIGAPELIDRADHTVATVVGGVLLLLVIVVGLFGISRVVDEAASGREVPVVVVPRLSNRPVEQAQAQLERLGLIVDVRYQANERVPVDVVIEQTPIAGARLEVGERVVLGVSDGPSGVRVPNTVGQPVADATRLLSVVGLVASPTEVYDEAIPAGVVLGSNPGPSGRSTLGASVELIVSKGPEPRIVPEVVGLASAEGMLQIGQADLNVGEVTRRVVEGVDPGKIASVDPGVGSAVPRGSRVDVVISAPPTPGTVPDLVGLRRVTALEIAESLGIRVSVTNETVPATDRRIGLVIAQSPVADSPRAGMTITIAVGPVPTTTTTTTTPGSVTTTTRP